MSARILLIDNYDSFVHNLARYLVELGCATEVVRNDVLTTGEIADRAPAAIVISPGPCTPAEAGVSCQVIAAALGGQIIRAPEPVHGRTSWISHHGQGVFAGLPNPFRAMRYHSLIVDEGTLPTSLRVVARNEEGLPMALEHTSWPLCGVQFHPESILTEGGHQMLANFLRLAGLDPALPETTDLVSHPTDDEIWKKRLQSRPIHW
jgi:anthranilate synthase component 2